MTIGDTIMKALNVIQTNGWCKFIRHDQYGRVCALGAVESALMRTSDHHYGSEYMQTVNALARYLPPVDEWIDELPENYQAYFRDDDMMNRLDQEALVACYNNLHTQQEVEELFEKAARNEGLTL